MKKALLILLSAIIMLSFGACSSKTESGEGSSAEVAQPAEPIKLVNKMTETERLRVNKHALTLLDEPVETEHKVSIEFATQTPEDMLADLEKCAARYPTSIMNSLLKKSKKWRSPGKAIPTRRMG